MAQIKSLRILTLADGFGDSKACPEWYPEFYKWPEIIKFMTKGVEVVNLSRYGAGNEYLLQCLKKHLADIDFVFVQWAMPKRLDLILAHKSNHWQEQISQDPVYKDNVIELGVDRWWLSSGSKSPMVTEYNGKIISNKQHQLRSQIFIEHAKLLLEKHGIDHRFLLSADSEYLNGAVDENNWCWHQLFKGMDSFRTLSKFANLDFGITQPISLIQLDFIQQFILPAVDLPWRSSREIAAVENMLYRKYQAAKDLKNT